MRGQGTLRDTLDATARRTDAAAAGTSQPCTTEEFPLSVVPDWEEQLTRAEQLCRIVDRHLDFEARFRLLQDLEDFRPQHLCPEQRVQLISDMYGATR
jgi:hypothetical protein